MRGGELRIMVLIQIIRQISMVKSVYSLCVAWRNSKAQITHEAKRLEEAEMVALLAEPSANRVEAVCPHYGICGGCSMQHIHPDEQIRLKQNVLQSHLQHFAGIQPEQWLEPIRSLQSDYRRRARIGVRYLPKQDRLILGFREHHSNRLTSIHTCSVLDKSYQIVCRNCVIYSKV